MREIKSFNKNWMFSKNELCFDKDIEGDRVDLPHTWNGIDGQDGGGDYYRGTGFYAKDFDIEELPRGEVRYLEINGANSSAEVYLNGKLIARHDGGYSKFVAELSGLKNHNRLLIKVDNSTNERVYPQFADFTFYGGLYRDVNVIGVPASHFELEKYAKGMRIETEILNESASVQIELYLKAQKCEHELEVEIFDMDGASVSRKRQNSNDRFFEITVVNPHLWDGKADPYLYRIESRLMLDGEILDSISSEFGLREFFVDAERGFFLNGKSYPLRGVARHQDRPGIGNAILKEHHDEDIALIDELGATAVRLAHYQHDDYFYTLCDRHGIVVWAEIPYISRHLSAGRENAVDQMRELVMQNYNHPSICIWGLSNEITMDGEENADLIEDHVILNELCHSLDPKRKTCVAALSVCSTEAEYLKIPDLVAYNHYFGWYGGKVSMNAEWLDDFHRKYPNRPIGISEYGAEGLDWHTSDPAQGDYTEEYQAHYHEEMIKIIDKRPYVFASFVWNMFDFASDSRAEGGKAGMNHKGLVNFDRTYKKDSFYAYKAWLSAEPFVHISGKRYSERADAIIKVKVYSNLPEVELFVNGVSKEKKTGKWFFDFDIEDSERSLRILAKAGAFCDEAHFERVDEFPEKYRLKEVHAILNWFDIDMPEGKLSLNDKINDIIVTSEGKKLFFDLISGIELKELPAMNMSKEQMLRMIGEFSLLRFVGLSSMLGLQFSKEDLIMINKKLNKIDR